MKIKEIVTIILIVLAGIYFMINANTKLNQKSNGVVITGKISNLAGEEISFINQDTSYTTKANTNGSFHISFDLDSGTYLSFRHGLESTAMYVYPGDKIELTINTELFDETIKYSGSPTSSFLAKKFLLEEKHDFFGEIYYLANTKAYKDLLEEYKNSVMSEFKEIHDTTFINSEITNLDKDINYFIQRQEKLSDYSEEVRNYMWETKDIPRNFNFYTALDSLNRNEFNAMGKQYEEAFQLSLNKLSDIDFISNSKEKIKNTINAWLDRKTSVDNMPKAGDPAIDFKYPDINGNEFSLSKFRGNLVYVDVWATWCGPCRAEIPSLQKLELDYHTKNITFMSISVDTDKEAWQKMVKDQELSGVQLWADGWGKITKDYAIFGIPRFMLFDTEGNVISTNAPRPSSDDIRGLLDANL